MSQIKRLQTIDADTLQSHALPLLGRLHSPHPEPPVRDHGGRAASVHFTTNSDTLGKGLEEQLRALS